MTIGDDWPDLLTVKEVAQILRVSPLTIKRWGKRGKLPAIRINSRGDRRCDLIYNEFDDYASLKAR